MYMYDIQKQVPASHSQQVHGSHGQQAEVRQS